MYVKYNTEWHFHHIFSFPIRSCCRQAAGSGLGTPLYDPFFYWLGASVGRIGGKAVWLLIGSLLRLSMSLSLVLRSRLMWGQLYEPMADVRPALRANGIKEMLIAKQSDIPPPKPNSFNQDSLDVSGQEHVL